MCRYAIPPPHPYLKAGETLSFTLRVVGKGSDGERRGAGAATSGSESGSRGVVGGSVLELLWASPLG